MFDSGWFAEVKKGDSMKKALITGVSGQDGSYLSDLLLSKGYEVIGMDRRKSDATRINIQHLLTNEHFKIIYGDMLEESRLNSYLKILQPDEIYHLAAQSFVHTSWDIPIYTCNVNAMGTLRLLEAMRIYCPKAKFYNASTSEIFGRIKENPQVEMTYQYPHSPYGCSKSFAHNITRNYRESYNLFCCNGICFNHESEKRGLEFVTRKITDGAVKIHLGKQKKLMLGNLDAKRDWGHAEDYVRAMYMMLQHDRPDDYIVASGNPHSVREFVEIAFKHLGMDIQWEGSGKNEKGLHNNEVVVEVSEEFYRPIDILMLKGDTNKIQVELGWTPNITFDNLVERMVRNDLRLLQ